MVSFLAIATWFICLKDLIKPTFCYTCLTKWIPLKSIPTKTKIPSWINNLIRFRTVNFFVACIFRGNKGKTGNTCTPKGCPIIIFATEIPTLLLIFKIFGIATTLARQWKINQIILTRSPHTGPIQGHIKVRLWALTLLINLIYILRAVMTPPIQLPVPRETLTFTAIEKTVDVASDLTLAIDFNVIVVALAGAGCEVDVLGQRVTVEGELDFLAGGVFSLESVTALALVGWVINLVLAALEETLLWAFGVVDDLAKFLEALLFGHTGFSAFAALAGYNDLIEAYCVVKGFWWFLCAKCGQSSKNIQWKILKAGFSRNSGWFQLILFHVILESRLRIDQVV